LSILHAPDRAGSHFFERFVIQLAPVILSHVTDESYSIPCVKRNVGLLTARLINEHLQAQWLQDTVLRKLTSYKTWHAMLLWSSQGHERRTYQFVAFTIEQNVTDILRRGSELTLRAMNWRLSLA
jgi:hypothetical protein